MNGIGERIRKLRKAQHLRQSDFGEMIGVSASYVSGLESGREIPTKKVKMLICEKMNINMEWLEAGTGDVAPIFLKLVQVGDKYVSIQRNGSYERMGFLISIAVAQFAEELTQKMAEEIAKEMHGEQPPTYYEVKEEIINQLLQAMEEYE